ncbi:right-handed parallel beta-helix repeat-containing protein [Microbulbifer sp. VAAF005]|uniref:right-handed parallel beta-helix repeat-containing protein n=1 Tax=Microbulbifer sp. VAAF005 TaxID=3034230 RepID=UPI0024AD70A7|nr:right-handed parallel beta-helix repeat-containing protein [Microbulbifer sp. VAAF005]WHI46465.1 right-handed parallel beta-helix repeat-containing protein [Microbulbifer sp. VAAF005]
MSVNTASRFSQDGFEIGSDLKFISKEPLNNSVIPLACRAVHNQGAASQECLDLSRSRNAECESLCTPRRAGLEGHSCCVAALAKGYGHSRRAAPNICSLQDPQRHYGVIQRLPNNIIENNGEAGLPINDYFNNIVSNSVTENGQLGINLSGDSSNSIAGNTISNNGISTLSSNGGIIVTNSNSLNNQITGNTLNSTQQFGLVAPFNPDCNKGNL